MKPILFSTPMVQATLAGRKTMTRRVVKPEPDTDYPVKMVPHYTELENHWGKWAVTQPDGETKLIKCPYGNPGDILWVRETWQYVNLGPEDENNGYVYKASENGRNRG